MDNELSLKQSEPEGIGLSLNANPDFLPPSDDVADQQSLKYHFALGDQSPGIESIKSSIQTGTTQDLRRVAAQNEEYKLNQAKKDVITGIVGLKGGNMSPEMASTLTYMAKVQPKVNPDTVLEKIFSDKFVSQAMVNNSSSNDVLDDASTKFPGQTDHAIDATTNYITNREIAIKRLQEIETEMEKQGWGGYLADLTSQAIPLKSSLRLNKAVPDVHESMFSGSQRIAQRHFLFSLPSDEFEPTFTKILTDLKSKNLRDAHNFAKEMVDYSYEQASGDNAFFLHEIQATGAIAGSLIPLKRLMGDTVKAAGKRRITVDEALAQMGDLDKAGDVSAAKIYTERSASKLYEARDPHIETENIAKQYPSIMSIRTGWDGVSPGSLSRERAMAQNDFLERKAAELTGGIADSTRIDRIAPEQLPVLLEEGKSLMQRDYGHMNHATLDIIHRPAAEFADNVGRLELQIGTPDKLLFKTDSQAEKWALKEYGLDIDRFALGTREGNIGRLTNDLGFPLGPTEKETVRETLKTPAIRLKDGTVISGESHGVAFLKAEKVTGKTVNEIIKENFDVGTGHSNAEPNGWITSKGRFVTEKEASKLSTTAKPELKPEVKPKTILTRLTPEEVATSKDKIVVGKEPGTVAFKFKTSGGKTGNIVAHVAEDDPKNLVISWIGTKKGFEGKINKFGPSFIRKLIPELQREFPGIEKISGYRMSGAKGDSNLGFGERVSIKIPPKPSQFLTAAEADIGMSIEQQGKGWYISIVRPLRETEPLARQLEIPTMNKNPEHTGNGFIGFLKSIGRIAGRGKVTGAGMQLSNEQLAKRYITTHVPNETKRLFSGIGKEIGDIRRESKGALDKVIQADLDYEFKGIPGRRATSQRALDQAFLDSTERLPTERETLGYRLFYLAMDGDLMLRDLNLSRTLHREGVEMMHLYKKNDNGEIEKTPFFQAASRKEIPWGDGRDAGIVLSKDGEAKFHFKNDIAKTETKQEIEKLINDEGYSVWQLAHPNDRPLGPWIGDNRLAHFVVTKEFGSKPLPMNLVDRMEGPHKIYEHMGFTKQPKIITADKGRLQYVGDQTIFLHTSGKEAKEVAPLMDELRQMYKRNEPGPMIDYFINKNFTQDKEWFDKQISSGYISLDHPITDVLHGQSTLEAHPELKKLYPGLIDEAKSPYNIYRNVDMSYLSERDLAPWSTIKQDSMDKPRWNIAKAETIDGFSSLNRAVGNAIRGMHMTDYKLYAIENWARQFGKYLDESQAKMVDTNPFEAFYYPKYARTADREGLLAAKNTRDRILEFLGTESEIGKDISWIERKVLENMESSTKFVKSSDMPFLRDPVGYFRNALVKLKFGFNPGTYMVQVQQLATATALEPRSVGQSYAASWAQRLIAQNLTSEILDATANKMTKFGWTKENFKEATLLMRRLGYDIVGGEHAIRTDTFDPKLFPTRFGAFADKGLFFFTEGERSARMTGLNAAYYAWRRANPDAILDRTAEALIVSRAQELIGGMTKATNGYLQNGTWVKTGSQFLTFNQRLLEQFWGNKLSVADKARLFTVHSALYGVPTAIGATTFWPMWDDMRTAALHRGYPVKDEWFKLLHDGFIDYATEMVTGSSYNVSRRLGSQGPDMFKKILFDKDGEKVLELIGGPVGTAMNSLWNNVAYPLYALFAGQMSGQTSSQLPILLPQVLDGLREASAVNNAYNAYYAFTVGKYFSRSKDALVTKDLSTMDSIFAALGFQRKDVTDAMLSKAYLRNREGAKAEMALLGEKAFNNAFDAIKEGNEDKLKAYMVQARVYLQVIGDMDDEEYNEVLTKALKNDRNTDVEKAMYNMAMKSGDKSWLSRLMGWQQAPDLLNQRLEQYMRNKK